MAERRGRERFVVRAAAVLDARPRRSRPTCCRSAERYGIGVLPWSPLAGGWLSGRYRGARDRRPAAAAERHARSVRPVDAENQRKLEAADALAELADEAGHAA